MNAWQTWSLGNHADQMHLWGGTVLGWGRVGKVAEFVAALVVVAELMGRDRLNTFGQLFKDLVGFGQRRLVSVRYYLAVWAFAGLWGAVGFVISNVANTTSGQTAVFLVWLTLVPVLLGWFLARGAVLTLIKVGGVIVLVCGFVLDLLAS
jgi:hypothetical protein